MKLKGVFLGGRSRILLFGFVLFVFLGIGWVSRHELALSWVHIREDWDFKRIGIQKIDRDGVYGYLRNGCSDPGLAAGTPCDCVVFIHGLGDNAQTWRSLLTAPWEQWKAWGARDPLRLLAVDLPGAGRSQKGGEASRYRVREQAKLIRNLMEPQCRQWTVVANDFGAAIGAWLALDWKEGISHLVLLDPLFIHPRTDPIPSWIAQPTLGSVKEFLNRAYSRSGRFHESYLNFLVRSIHASRLREIWEAQTPEDQVVNHLEKITQKTLVLWGQQDHILPIPQGKELLQKLKLPIWQEVEGCGHFPQIECPAPVGKAITGILNYGAI